MNQFKTCLRSLAMVAATIGSLSLTLFACSSNDAPGTGPSSACEGVTCSGHGVCEEKGGTGVCKCSDGYQGEACDQCAPGFAKSATGSCEHAHAGCESKDCGDHGTCTEEAGAAHCVCATGYDGAACQLCYPGYHKDGDACVLDLSCLANSCSGHGACDDSSGVVTCACQTGYTGDHCESCTTGNHEDTNGNCVPNEDCAASNPCGAHSTCDDSSGVVVCKCEDGYDGDYCSSCQAGFHDDGSGSCVLDEQCLPGTCAGHGSCAAKDGVISCTCANGYASDHCETCAPKYHRNDKDECVADEDCAVNDPCGAHGTCDDATGVITCHCDAGYGGAACSTCQGGYHDDGAGTCVLDQQCMANTCSGHGTCSVSAGLVSCSCDAGYTGLWCHSCDVGYHVASDGSCAKDEDCAANDPCGAHGTCDDATGVITCHCDAGYTGDKCDKCYPGYEVNMVSGKCEIPCGDDWIRCDGKCKDASLTDNCGACGNDCGDMQCVKSGHQFSCGCPAKFPLGVCGSACVNLNTDMSNCGACGHHCDATAKERCFNGTCVAEATGCGSYCYANSSRICCGSACLLTSQLLTDEAHCGTCDNKCAAGQICVGGQCRDGQNSCSSPCRPDRQLCCAGTCMYDFQLEKSNDNCGSCGVKCGANMHCNQGTCRCNDGFLDCGSGCVDVRQDDQNCGSCGHACNSGEACVYGACVKDNPTGCGGACSGDEFCCSIPVWPNEECASVTSMTSDVAHCGGCTPCFEGETCSNGACSCSFTKHAYCNGVCTNLMAHDSCGDCGVKCSAIEKCTSSGCKVPASNTCNNPDNMGSSKSYMMCNATPSGFKIDTCASPQDGSYYDQFHLYTVPDSTHTWKASFSSPNHVSHPQMVAWVAQGSDYCDSKTQNLGCSVAGIRPYYQDLTFGPLPKGTKVVIYVYNVDSKCGTYEGEYSLRVTAQ